MHNAVSLYQKLIDSYINLSNIKPKNRSNTILKNQIQYRSTSSFYRPEKDSEGHRENGGLLLLYHLHPVSFLIKYVFLFVAFASLCSIVPQRHKDHKELHDQPRLSLRIISLAA
jgi:hypothetical protein